MAAGDFSQTEARVSLVLKSAEITADEMAEKLSTKASHTLAIGDRLGFSHITAKVHSWSIRSEWFSPSEYDLDNRTNSLLEQLMVCEASLREMTSGGRVEAYVQFDIHIVGEDQFPFTLRPQTLEKVVRIGASIDLDIYSVSKS